MALTDLACRNAKCPTDKRFKRFADSGGLYLEVTASGSKLWRLKYRVAGVEKRLSFGAYPDVPLASRVQAGVTIKGARELRDEARATLAAGHDPAQVKRDLKIAAQIAANNSFESVAMQWWNHWRPSKTTRHADYVRDRLKADVLPDIGARPITDLSAMDFVRVAKAIEGRGATELARRSLQTCSMILRYAVAHGLAERNPVADVKPLDILQPRVVINFARVTADDLPELLRRMAGYQGTTTVRSVLALMALTFVRTSELINARWQEFDIEHALWTIPADRTGRKGAAGNRRQHLVPLSAQALDVLRTLRTFEGEERCIGDAMVFRNERDPTKPMSNGTILAALRRMGYARRMTGHGFRGVASTALNEMGWRFDVVEAQLSHVQADRTRAAYNHAQYLAERATMMQAWADYLDAARQSDKVIPFRRAQAAA